MVEGKFEFGSIEPFSGLIQCRIDPRKGLLATENGHRLEDPG
jgi:hypothetical protein